MITVMTKISKVSRTSTNPWPVYFKDRLIIGNLDSPVGVVTLWTPKEKIAARLNPNSYCAIGQLYTARGVNFILRNILARPTINRLIVCGADLTGSGEVLLNLDSKHLDHKVSQEAISSFRENVQLIDQRGQTAIKLAAGQVGEAKPWRKPERFSDPEPVSVKSFPSENDLFRVRGRFVGETWPVVLQHLLKFGLTTKTVITHASEESTMRELLNLAVVITDEDPKKPELPTFLPFKQADLKKYLEGFFAPKRGSEDYNYGERLFNWAAELAIPAVAVYPWLKLPRFQKFFPHGGFDQVAGSIVKKLASFPTDKGAMAILANHYTDVFPARPPRTTPCLTLIQCQTYEGKLNLTAYFRSNDVFGGWPLNALALRTLQGDLAGKLSCDLGPLITIANMAHLYDHNFDQAQKVVGNHYQLLCQRDPRGDFVVEVQNNEIIATHLSSEGELLAEYRQNGGVEKAALKLGDQILKDLGVSDLGHAMDLGRQLAKAEAAIKLNLKFEQDNSLTQPGR